MSLSFGSLELGTGLGMDAFEPGAMESDGIHSDGCNHLEFEKFLQEMGGFDILNEYGDSFPIDTDPLPHAEQPRTSTGPVTPSSELSTFPCWNGLESNAYQGIPSHDDISARAEVDDNQHPIPVQHHKDSERKERNRANAAISRKRRNQYLTMLEDRCARLESDNSILLSQLHLLTQENTSLKAQIPQCPTHSTPLYTPHLPSTTNQVPPIPSSHTQLHSYPLAQTMTPQPVTTKDADPNFNPSALNRSLSSSVLRFTAASRTPAVDHTPHTPPQYTFKPNAPDVAHVHYPHDHTIPTPTTSEPNHPPFSSSSQQSASHPSSHTSTTAPGSPCSESEPSRPGTLVQRRTSYPCPISHSHTAIPTPAFSPLLSSALQEYPAQNHNHNATTTHSTCSSTYLNTSGNAHTTDAQSRGVTQQHNAHSPACSSGPSEPRTPDQIISHTGEQAPPRKKRGRPPGSKTKHVTSTGHAGLAAWTASVGTPVPSNSGRSHADRRQRSDFITSNKQTRVITTGAITSLFALCCIIAMTTTSTPWTYLNPPPRLKSPLILSSQLTATPSPTASRTGRTLAALAPPLDPPISPSNTDASLVPHSLHHAAQSAIQSPEFVCNRTACVLITIEDPSPLTTRAPIRHLHVRDNAVSSETLTENTLRELAPHALQPPPSPLPRNTHDTSDTDRPLTSSPLRLLSSLWQGSTGNAKHGVADDPAPCSDGDCVPFEDIAGEAMHLAGLLMPGSCRQVLVTRPPESAVDKRSFTLLRSPGMRTRQSVYTGGDRRAGVEGKSLEVEDDVGGESGLVALRESEHKAEVVTQLDRKGNHWPGRGEELGSGEKGGGYRKRVNDSSWRGDKFDGRGEKAADYVVSVMLPVTRTDARDTLTMLRHLYVVVLKPAKEFVTYACELSQPMYV